MFLYQEESGFLFNSDSHFLYDFIASFNPRGKVLDIGCGCGILGLLCARDFTIDLYSIDSQEHNSFLTLKNAKINALQTTAICDNFLTHDFDQKFDFILSNPPYYHNGVTQCENTKMHISRYNNHLPLSAMIQKANQIIAPRGHLLFCYDAKQLQEIMQILHDFKFTVEDIRFVYGTMHKKGQLVMIHARKGSRSLCNILPPLVHFKEGELSVEAADIYHKTRTYSIKCKTI